MAKQSDVGRVLGVICAWLVSGCSGSDGSDRPPLTTGWHLATDGGAAPATIAGRTLRIIVTDVDEPLPRTPDFVTTSVVHLEPIEAVVRITSVATGEVRTDCDRTGHFQFDGIASGQYELDVLAADAQTPLDSLRTTSTAGTTAVVLLVYPDEAPMTCDQL